MANGNEELVRNAYEAYASGDVATMLRFVDPDLEWTYLDPAFEDPEPQVCHGTQELRVALQRQARRGLKSRLEEVHANGDLVMVALHTPGLDELRARKADDRNYDVLTVRDGRIVAMRACKNRGEALQLAGVTDEA
jgi:ketosteroid isomerase-like protein